MFYSQHYSVQHVHSVKLKQRTESKVMLVILRLAFFWHLVWGLVTIGFIDLEIHVYFREEILKLNRSQCACRK